MKEKKNCRKLQEADIPKIYQQPRSHSARRRTDFSAFLSPSHCPHSNPGSTLEFSSYKNGISSITTATVDQIRHASVLRVEEELPKFPLMHCMSSDAENSRSLCSSRGVTCTNVESVAQNASPDTSDNGSSGQHTTNYMNTIFSYKAKPFTPYKSASQVSESGGVRTVPGSVVWAKTTRQIWWPAEVVGKRSSASNQTVGRVLVQFYGNNECAWVNPVGDLSHFEDCFEERSCNPMETFQDALNRALHRKQHLISSKQWDKSPDVLMDSNHQGQLHDKWNSLSSSRKGDDFHAGGRGKRKRKPKVHFDEVALPIKTKRNGRRVRIMRSLGLIPPSGSPFTVASTVRTAHKSCRVLDDV